MKSIYKCSEYGFLEVEHDQELDKSLVELATSCVQGVYGIAFVEKEKILHVIFDPTITDLDEISHAIILSGCERK